MCRSLTKIAVAAVVFAGALVFAQEKPATQEKSANKENVAKPATETAAKEDKPEPIPNPVTSTVRQIVDRQCKNIVAAAEEMPAEKYDFHPTEAQMTFAHLIAHITDSNNFLCSRISDQPETKAVIKDTDSKARLVQALKASFDYCSAALEKTDDSKLGDTVTLLRGRKAPRAAAVIALTNDFADHYGTAAMYLRLNGMLPPTAQK